MRRDRAGEGARLLLVVLLHLAGRQRPNMDHAIQRTGHTSVRCGTVVPFSYWAKEERRRILLVLKRTDGWTGSAHSLVLSVDGRQELNRRGGCAGSQFAV
jgi:hypothetical protein